MRTRTNEEILDYFDINIGDKIKVKKESNFDKDEIYELKIDDGYLGFFGFNNYKYCFYDVMFVMRHSDWFDYIRKE